jgi:hypothetical protein
MHRSIERPWTIALACAASFAISVWDVVSSVSGGESIDSHFFLALLVALIILPVIFTFAAFFRRNWGRIALAVITGLGLVSVPLFALFLEEMAGPLDSEAVLYAIAETVVIALLFVPVSNKWYRRSRASEGGH